MFELNDRVLAGGEVRVRALQANSSKTRTYTLAVQGRLVGGSGTCRSDNHRSRVAATAVVTAVSGTVVLRTAAAAPVMAATIGEQLPRPPLSLLRRWKR